MFLFWVFAFILIPLGIFIAVLKGFASINRSIEDFRGKRRIRRAEERGKQLNALAKQRIAAARKASVP